MAPWFVDDVFQGDCVRMMASDDCVSAKMVPHPPPPRQVVADSDGRTPDLLALSVNIVPNSGSPQPQPPIDIEVESMFKRATAAPTKPPAGVLKSAAVFESVTSLRNAAKLNAVTRSSIALRQHGSTPLRAQQGLLIDEDVPRRDVNTITPPNAMTPTTSHTSSGTPTAFAGVTPGALLVTPICDAMAASTRTNTTSGMTPMMRLNLTPPGHASSPTNATSAATATPTTNTNTMSPSVTSELSPSAKLILEAAGMQFLSGSLPTRYRRLQLLGEGGCGVVWAVERTADGKRLAAKIVPLSRSSESKRRYAFDEPIFMSMCDSTFTVRYVDHWTDNKSAVVTVMELIDGVDLNEHIRRLGETAAHHVRQARRLARGLPEVPIGATACPGELADGVIMSPRRMRQLQKDDPTIRSHLQAASNRAISESSCHLLFVQMLVGLHHIHSKGIVHRDIKAGNVFLCSTGLVKIGDFGLSCTSGSPCARSHPQPSVSGAPFIAACAVGTPCYMAPELWCTEGMPPYSVTSDMWALGVVLYEMLTGRRPFPRGTTAEIGAAILKRETIDVLHYAPKTSPTMVSLVQSLMHPDPACRPTAWEALQTPLMRQARTDLMTVVTADDSMRPMLGRMLLELQSASPTQVNDDDDDDDGSISGME